MDDLEVSLAIKECRSQQLQKLRFQVSVEPKRLNPDSRYLLSVYQREGGQKVKLFESAELVAADSSGLLRFPLVQFKSDELAFQ